MSKPLFAQLPHQKINKGKRTNLSKPDFAKPKSHVIINFVCQINFAIAQSRIPWIQLQSLGVKQKDDTLNKNLLTAFLFKEHKE